MWGIVRICGCHKNIETDWLNWFISVINRFILTTGELIQFRTESIHQHYREPIRICSELVHWYHIESIHSAWIDLVGYFGKSSFIQSHNFVLKIKIHFNLFQFRLSHWFWKGSFICHFLIQGFKLNATAIIYIRGVTLLSNCFSKLQCFPRLMHVFVN